ncbi:MAG TPA: (Fe-S)-binding protein [Nitrospinota bacterium]|nr:(Fe-S)-binding protein [Nitrospinota bacterium]|tara:strand:- start:118484 stop:119227 length:744 start_codon:yes stop_codon:yes gene_type:complete
MGKPSEIYFMATCLADLFYPKVGIAGMRLIQREGIRVVFPQNQTCCGQPAYNSGYREEALDVARSLMSCFPKDIPIVVPSGSCAGMIRHQWPELFHGQPDAQNALNVSKRTYELTQFLVDQVEIELDDLGPSITVAIHTSCSSRNEMKVASHIESLVSQMKNVTVVEQERKAECCGFGGSFAIKQAEISGAMVKDKTDAIGKTEASKLVSQDCGCLMNIGGALRKQKRTIEVQHIAEFLWDRVYETG